jgi:uridine kinase
VNEASLSRAATAIAGLPRDRRRLVAIDGLDGAGKTTFADRLAPRLDRPVVRVREDDFLNPAAIRHARGRESPDGFFLDSYDLGALARELLDPFAAGGPFRRRWHDAIADRPVPGADEHAPADAVLVLDGLFLHRDELRDRWDLSILLDVPPGVAGARLLEREGMPNRPRYILGLQRYFAECDPASRASLVLPW